MMDEELIGINRPTKNRATIDWEGTIQVHRDLMLKPEKYETVRAAMASILKEIAAAGLSVTDPGVDRTLEALATLAGWTLNDLMKRILQESAETCGELEQLRVRSGN